MSHLIHNTGVAKQIGTAYSDAIEVAPNLRWLITSGTPGLSTNGEIAKDFTGQAEQTWKNIILALEQAGMTVADLVKVSQYLTRAEDIQTNAKVRSRFLGDVRPAFMLLVVNQLVRPEFLIEVEIIAAKQ